MLIQPSVPPRRRRRFRLWNPTTYAVILLALAIVSVASWKMQQAGWIESHVARIVSAPLRLLEGARIRLVEIGRNIQATIRIPRELATLRKEVDRLRRENQELRIAAAEAEHLRSLFDLPDRFPFHALPALVINRDLVTSQAVIINRGREHGVGINQPVISASQGLVGRTERVLSTTSRVQLLTDYNSVVGVRIEGKSLEAIVRGHPRDDALIMSDILHIGGANVSPEKGDKVFTSGVGRVFPPNILVGHVESAVPGEDELFRVEPAVDGRLLYKVLILLDIDRREEGELIGSADVS